MVKSGASRRFLPGSAVKREPERTAAVPSGAPGRGPETHLDRLEQVDAEPAPRGQDDLVALGRDRDAGAEHRTHGRALERVPRERSHDAAGHGPPADLPVALLRVVLAPDVERIRRYRIVVAAQLDVVEAQGELRRAGDPASASGLDDLGMDRGAGRNRAAARDGERLRALELHALADLAMLGGDRSGEPT